MKIFLLTYTGNDGRKLFYSGESFVPLKSESLEYGSRNDAETEMLELSSIDGFSLKNLQVEEK